MVVFNKNKFLYSINILLVIYLLFIIIYSSYSILFSYNALVTQCLTIENEYKKTLDKYKNISRFLLKNGLIKNISAFNSWGSAIYNLPPIKEFKNHHPINNLLKIVNKDLNYISECYNEECITVSISKKEVLKKILATKIEDHYRLDSIPNKFTLLKISAHSFLSINNALLLFSLFCLTIWYLAQTIFLLTSNKRWSKSYLTLLSNANKNKLKLIRQLTECNILSNSLVLTQKIVSEYFTHYIHQLITKKIFIEQIDITTIINQVETFLSYYVTKHKVRLTLDYMDTIKTIKSDREIIFIILLNSIYKAIYRSKMSSQITIKIITLLDKTTNIEISDVGYDIKNKQNDTIQIYELPLPILNKLCQKIKVAIEDTRKNEINTISVKIFNESVNEINDNIIRLNFYGKNN